MAWGCPSLKFDKHKLLGALVVFCILNTVGETSTRWILRGQSSSSRHLAGRDLSHVHHVAEDVHGRAKDDREAHHLGARAPSFVRKVYQTALTCVHSTEQGHVYTLLCTRAFRVDAVKFHVVVHVQVPMQGGRAQEGHDVPQHLRLPQ